MWGVELARLHEVKAMIGLPQGGLDRLSIQIEMGAELENRSASLSLQY